MKLSFWFSMKEYKNLIFKYALQKWGTLLKNILLSMFIRKKRCMSKCGLHCNSSFQLPDYEAGMVMNQPNALPVALATHIGYPSRHLCHRQEGG